MNCLGKVIKVIIAVEVAAAAAVPALIVVLLTSENP
jgi:hypothetical protein